MVDYRASAMAVRDELQLYLVGSKIYGWYPCSRREVRLNAPGIYLDRSPVGALSLPYQVGSDGWSFNADFIVAF